jgi:serine/threonine protein kinase
LRQPECDRNLLFGILALHNGFISRDALIRGMSAWIADKATPLGQILVRQGDLAPDHHAVMEVLVQAHLKQHAGDAAQSLAALNTTALAKVLVEAVPDADVMASLAPHGEASTRAEAGSEEGGRAPAGVGLPTSAGRRFQVLRAHAEGGLGVVYVARDEELHREVALKQIKERYCHDGDSQTRFVAEAEITGGLEHPGIVPVYGLGKDEHGRPYYAMRFIRGESLRDAVDRFHQAGAAGPGRDRGQSELELRRLLGQFIDVCEAIAYAHSRGVVHRDLKPANIMLGRYGETLVVDWGLAKAVGRDEVAARASPGELTLRPSSGSDAAMTASGAALGTPAFMSPEQAAGRLDDLGPPSDVYGLGATLYYLLTGRAPFKGGDLQNLLSAVQQGAFPPPRQVTRSVPVALEAICLKAMARHPADRYASAQALAGDIEHWMADEPVSAYREGPPARLARWARRHRSTVVLGIAALVLTTIAVWVGLTIRQRQIRQAHAHREELRLASLKEEQLANEQLGEFHILSDQLPAAEAVLVRAAQRLEGEPALSALRDRLTARSQEIHRLVAFRRLADQAERLAFDAAEDDAIACCEAALEPLGIFVHAEWWNHLPVEGLADRQVERLRDEVYRQIILLAGVRAQKSLTLFDRAAAAPHCREGLKLIGPALRFRPHDQSAHIIEFFCRYGLGEPVDRLASSEPKSAADYYFVGVLHHWIANMPNDPLTRLVTRRARDLSGLDFETALATAERYLRTAAAMDPDHYWSNFWLGVTLISTRKHEAAELALNTCVAIRPDDALAYNYRALVLRLAAAEKSPEDGERLNRRAQADLDRALALEPYSAQVHRFRFLFDTALDQVDTAVDEALRFLESERPVHTKSGWGVFDVRNEYTEVQQVLGQLDQRHGNRPDVWGALARAHLAFEESSEDEKAVQAAERALTLRAGDPQATLVLAAVALRRKQPTAAEGFRNALAALPNDFLANQGLAEALEQAGQAADALTRYEQTVRIAKRDWQRREAHQGRARVLRRLGRNKDAELAERAAREAGLGGDEH